MQEASKEEKQKAMVTADKLLKDGGYSKTTKVKIMVLSSFFVVDIPSIINRRGTVLEKEFLINFCDESR
jgi:hypothetical protein